MNTPRLLITMGDVAGIGPEIIARAWPKLVAFAHPVVIGDVDWLRKGIAVTGESATVQPITSLADAVASPTQIPCLNPSDALLSDVPIGKITAAGGKAAYDFLCYSIDATKAGLADAIVTCPLHKEGLHLAGVHFPGHTEILADRTGIKEFGMVLWGDGIAVVHVTLHMALRNVFANITTESVTEKIRLLDGLLPRLLGRPARIGVAALNPHGSDGGLFGNEEADIIAPAVAAGRSENINASGPWPADTLFVRAHKGEFDGIVAMYHDEGHIAMKLRCGPRCVNITVGLPIIRTSVAHGTAYDIAGKGIADAGSLVSAADVAAKLAANRAVAV